MNWRNIKKLSWWNFPLWFYYMWTKIQYFCCVGRLYGEDCTVAPVLELLCIMRLRWHNLFVYVSCVIGKGHDQLVWLIPVFSSGIICVNWSRSLPTGVFINVSFVFALPTLLSFSGGVFLFVYVKIYILLMEFFSRRSLIINCDLLPKSCKRLENFLSCKWWPIRWIAPFYQWRKFYEALTMRWRFEQVPCDMCPSLLPIRMFLTKFK